jgi:transcriptional regulator with XRE-family HTH domain
MRPDKVIANDLLRDARLGLISPSGSGRELSREELADAVNRWVYDNLREEISCTALSIGVLERGQTRWPRKSVRKGLCGVFGRSETELGLYSNRDLRVRESGSSQPATDLVISDAPGGSEVVEAANPHRVESAPPVTAGHIDRAFKELGLRLRQWRIEADLSQQQVANATKYSRSTVANVETGRQNITRDFWDRADQALAAEGSLVAEFDHICELKRRLRIKQIEERARVAGPHDGIQLTEPVMVSGSFSLMVSATPMGGVRVVIETGPSGLAGSHSAWEPGDANVLSFDQARRDRIRRLP